MIQTASFAKVAIDSLDDLRIWLAQNHEKTESVWLVRFKKSVPAKYVDRLDVLDELLCWGWVDGLARKLDDEQTMQLISLRRQQIWSKTYKDRVEKLAAAGRMKAPGLAAIATSKALGLWDAYEHVDLLQVPQDLREALKARPKASVFFDASAPSYRRNVLRWINSAKRPETRTARIAKTLEFSAAGNKLPQM
jgi:uncharacterized protein YdeI (YjbR/CyaY-like superfamily)